MATQARSPGIPRKIVGFHQDENCDWVADLECGHQQYVRHDPPWTNRHWVTTSLAWIIHDFAGGKRKGALKD